MFRKAAITAVALVGASLTEAAKLKEAVANAGADFQKRDGAHGHDHAHAAAPAAPASGYSAPAASYSAPAASYGAPAASYGAPAPSYGAPAPSYEEPAPSYGAPSYGAPSYEVEEQPGFFPDVTFIIVGILIVIGLSLLFPTYVSLTTVRRKRDVAEEVDPTYNMVERVTDIFNSVVQSESCLERIACEIGGLSSDMGIKQMAKLADPFVSNKYKGYFQQFHSGKNCNKIKCGTLSF